MRGQRRKLTSKKRDTVARVGGLALALAVLLGGGLLHGPARAEEAGLPAGANEDWWTRAQRQLAESEYHVTWQEETCLEDLPAAWQAPNRAHGFRTYFTDQGIRVVPRAEERPSWEWSLSLSGLRRGREKVTAETAFLHPRENRVEYRRGDLTEWYVNSPEGLEQGFTLEVRPGGNSPALLGVDLILSGGLIPRFAADGQSADFVTSGGERVLHYASLRVTDATDREVPSLMQGFREGATGGIRLLIDDREALYPLTIDPLLTDPSWTREGNQVSAIFGFAVATAGDVNGDGYSDVIIGASGFDNGQSDEGRIFVYHGSASGLHASPDWTAESNNPGAHFGRSLHTAGDVNNDGYSDVIIGAPYWDNPTAGEGGAWVYLGSKSGLDQVGARPSGTPANADWSAESNQGDAYFGNSVSPAGDVNGDGYGDVIVGALGYSNPQTKEGRVFVYYGDSYGLPAAASWTAESDYVNAEIGRSVGMAGDVNGDGYGDIIVGAWKYENMTASEGAAFVFHGSASGLNNGSRPVGYPSNADWSAEGNAPGTYMGSAVFTAGDVNGDGYADVIVGAQYYDNGQADEGGAFVFHGSKWGLDLGGSRPVGSPSNADWRAEGNQASARFGSAVSTAGDVDGDGYAEIVVAAIVYDTPGPYTNAGRVSVYRGSAVGLSASPMRTWDGTQNDAYLGSSVGTAGDVNGDGYADVVVGSYGHDNGQTDEGRAYVYHGSAGGLVSEYAWMQEENRNGARLGIEVSTSDVNGDGYADLMALSPYGGGSGGGRFHVYHGDTGSLPASPSATRYGAFDCVANAGDVNGDGYMDVIVGDGGYDNGQVNEGRVWIYFGGSAGISASPDWSAEVNVVDAWLGEACSAAGDVDGDGYGDVIVGAPGYNRNYTQQGCAFIYHGASGGPGTTPDSYHRCGPSSYDHFGAAVASAGDVNRDGFSDVLVGAPDAGNGYAALYAGSLTGVPNDSLWERYGDPVDCASGAYGASVASAGDVDGDGFSDILVGAPDCNASGADSGTAYLYYGSPSGPGSSWYRTGASSYHHFGDAVAGAGDVNGDGFADVIIGAPREGTSGQAFVYRGSASGLATSGLTLNGLHAWDYFGDAVAGGDVNGDGFSDVIVGASQYESDSVHDVEGAVLVYYGGGGPGLNVRPRQRPYSDASPLAPLAATPQEDRFRLRVRGRTPFGRSSLKVEWEVRPLGTSFNGNASDGGYGWSGIAAGGTELSRAVTGLTKSHVYHWRARLRYHPGKTPLAQASRWFTVPWNGWQEADFRTPGCSDGDGDGYGSPASAWCSYAKPDCDDSDSSVYPGAPQVCDGKNNNCDDASWPTVPANEIDNDGDTYAECEGDCHDGQPAMFPGNPEVCDNLDNDCNGAVDGFPTSCGLGECASTGTCTAGVDSCAPGDPSPEVCDGLDNNCDGSVPPDEADSDGDGHRICHGDCDDDSDLVWGTPSAIRNLRRGTDDQTLVWDEPLDRGGEAGGLYYDTLRSTDSADFMSALCVETDDGPNRTATDPETPAPGEVFYYLVRSDNDCPGSGPLGDGNGAPREGAECVACAHDTCDIGPALDPSCDPCVDQICQEDPYCCDTYWDSVCVGEVESVCGETC